MMTDLPLFKLTKGFCSYNWTRVQNSPPVLHHQQAQRGSQKLSIEHCVFPQGAFISAT